MQAHHFPSEFVVLDVETTGFKPELGHEIIEVAGQRIVGQRVAEEFHALVLPSRRLSPEVAAFNGITHELLEAEGQPAEQVFPSFVEFLKDAVLIGHNVGFDIGFLNSHLLRLERAALANQTLDTLELARRYLLLPSYSLESVARYLQVPQPLAHRAQADVETTRQVFLKLVERALNKVNR